MLKDLLDNSVSLVLYAVESALRASANGLKALRERIVGE